MINGTKDGWRGNPVRLFALDITGVPAGESSVLSINSVTAVKFVLRLAFHVM